MSTQYAEDDAIPYDIVDDVEIGDLTDQQGGLLDRASRVSFEIRKATVRTTEDKENNKNWMVKKLALEVAVCAGGIDGEGKSANSRLFPEFILKFNEKDYPEKYGSDWWQNKSRYPTKMLFKALDIPLKGLTVNDDFLINLVGREFVADIKQKQKQEKVNGKYVKIDGEFENELTNFRAA